MTNGRRRFVNYLMSGPAHLPYLVVSLSSLRQHYNGAIRVFAWPGSYPLVQEICSDKRIMAEAHLREPVYRGRNSQFLDKIRLMRSFTDDSNVHVYLDADTKIQGGISPLFEAVDGSASFCATQFCDWLSNEGSPRKRISNLIGRKPINQVAVETAMNQPMPSLNGGVFACRGNSPALRVWEEWTAEVLDIFIADETVLHAVQADFAMTPYFTTMTGGAWNCSPKYKPAGLFAGDVKIWHFHGDSNTRLSKCPIGVSLWYPYFVKCLEHNVGRVNDWIDSINNKFLTELENSDYARSIKAGVLGEAIGRD